MGNWDDDLKSIAAEIDRKDERIEYFHRLAVSRLEQVLSAQDRIAELELLLASAVNRYVSMESQLRIVEAALARATAGDNVIRMANANLIACAPALYMALKDFAGVVEFGRLEIGELAPMIVQARAILAKARGEHV